VAATAPGLQDAAGRFGEAAAGQRTPELAGLLGVAHDTTRGMLEAEDALNLLRERFERAGEREAQGELAAEALDQVERQLNLARLRRQQLDSIEGKLWPRQSGGRAIERRQLQAG
jgi:hypothetical protein